MISVDFTATPNAHAEVKALPADKSGAGFVYLTIEDGQSGFTLFGKSGDRARFEKIAALLNESFDAQRPERRHRSDPAELAGDYLGAL